MKRGDRPLRVGILVYPGAQLSAVHGLTDLFDTADRLRSERDPRSAGVSVQQLRVDDGLPAPGSPLTALILPPSLQQGAPGDPLDTLTAWILARYDEGTLLCSVCVGTFLLAHTGLLDGRPATTHWALAERFSQRFPDVELDADKLIIDDGDIITAGGLMAWVDLGLKLIDRLLGPDVMLATARYFLVDPGGREQRFYSSFAPNLTHGDAGVLAAQRWLRAKSNQKISLAMMAKAARMSERTFMRRFQAATGLKPTQYLQHLRVQNAREQLERSTLSIDEIAGKVGYEDSSAFRKIFRRIMGISPGEYRRRFSVEPASRARP